MLRPLVAWLAAAGVTANQVTVFAGIASAGIGILLCNLGPTAFLILPPFLFIRMALNAADGMLAREFNQKSNLGVYLNELSDVAADSFLYLPFAYLPRFDPLWIGVVIVLAILSEMTGVVGVMVGANRRYDGPMGKSDRAFAFGALAFYVGIGGPLSREASQAFSLLIAALVACTIVNRVRKGLAGLRIT